MIDLAPLAAELGCGFTSIRSGRFASVTFTGWRLEIETDADLPADLDVREFPLIDHHIVADATAAEPRKLELLLVHCG